MALTVTSRGFIWNTTAGNKSPTAFTPAVGDVLVVFVANSGRTTAQAPTVADNNSDGLGTYTKVGSDATKNTSADSGWWFIRDSPIGSASSTTVTVTQSSDTGGGCQVWSVGPLNGGGPSRVGAKGKQDNQAAATPSLTLDATPLSTSAIFGAVFTGTNGSANSAPPTSFSESNDAGYNNPTSGLETVFRASGHTSTTVAWTAAAPSAFLSSAIEVLAAQTVSVALLNQAAATFAPTIAQNQTLSVGLIDRTAATFTPTVASVRNLTISLLDQTAIPSAPTISVGAAPVTIGLLSQPAATFTPTISATASISVALIDRTAAAFDPTVATAGVGAPTWTTPADGVAMPPNPELKFTIPTAASPMHFNLQLDTVNTFDSGSLRDIRSDLDQTGWAFWDGDSWEPVPVGGVDESFAGNEARYTVSPDLTSTTWYRRVRAGTS